jgi:hypothetical protein
VSRARNRQGVLLPSREPELAAPNAAKESAPLNKRKSFPPVRGAGLKGRAAQMVGLATTKEAPTESEVKQSEASAPVKNMSSLMAMCVSKVNDQPVNVNDLSPPKSIDSNVM